MLVCVALSRRRLCPHHILAGTEVHTNQRMQMKTAFCTITCRGSCHHPPKHCRVAWAGEAVRGCAARPLSTQTLRVSQPQARFANPTPSDG